MFRISNIKSNISYFGEFKNFNDGEAFSDLLNGEFYNFKFFLNY